MLRVLAAFGIGLAAGWLFREPPPPSAPPPAPAPAPIPAAGVDEALALQVRDAEERLALLRREATDQERRRLFLEQAVAAVPARTSTSVPGPSSAGIEDVLRRMEDPDAKVREDAAHEALKFPPGEVGPRLERLLGSANPGARISAAWALGMLGDKSRAGAVARLLESPDPATRVVALEALARIKEPSVLPAVARQLGGSDEETKSWALHALRDITGQAFKDAPEALTWLSQHPR